MLLAMVVVKAPSGTTHTVAPSVGSNPTGMLKPVIASAPVIWKSEPEGVIRPAAEATAAVVAGGTLPLPNPGAILPVTDEQTHRAPALPLSVVTRIELW